MSIPYSIEMFRQDMALLGLPQDGRRPTKAAITRVYFKAASPPGGAPLAVTEARDRLVAWLDAGAPPLSDTGETPPPGPVDAAPRSPADNGATAQKQAEVESDAADVTKVAADLGAWQEALGAQQARHRRRRSSWIKKAADKKAADKIPVAAPPTNGKASWLSRLVGANANQR